MTNNIKAGDVVRLKSGGPKMTVTSTKENNCGTAGQTGTIAETAWFVGMDGPVTGEFDTSCLTINSNEAIPKT